MPKSSLHIKSPDEAETVFYEAFMRGDREVMAALWAEGDVICIHPGSGAIIGRDAVVRSWDHILADSHPGEIRYTVANKIESDDCAVHVVSEEIMGNGMVMAVVIATNVYRKFANGWLMVEHQGSLVQTAQTNETLQ